MLVAMVEAPIPREGFAGPVLAKPAKFQPQVFITMHCLKISTRLIVGTYLRYSTLLNSSTCFGRLLWVFLGWAALLF